MKRILHIALVSPQYSATGLMKGFLGSGFSEYFMFDYWLKTYEFGREVMQKMLIQEAERLKPDMIFCQIQNSEVLNVDTFTAISKISFVVIFTCDIRSKEQTQWLYDLAGIVGLICFSNMDDVEQTRRMGFKNTMCLQSSVDIDVYKSPEVSARDNAAVFIGNNTLNTQHGFPKAKERKEMVDFIRLKFPAHFDVYGIGWHSDFLSPMQEVNEYQSSAIGICHNQFEAQMYTSDRIWRLMSCGCFCLTQYFPGIHLMFTKGLHLDWWQNFDELEEKLNYYLSYPEQARIIAKNGMNHVRLNHNWSVRISTMLDFIKSISSPKKTPCIEAHTIDGKIPEPADGHFDGRICDCAKLIWKFEECNCGDKKRQLRAYENI